MKLKNVFNSMGFAGQYGKLGTLMLGLTEDVEALESGAAATEITIGNIQGDVSDALSLVSDALSLLNKIVALTNVTVTFDADGGSSVEAQTIPFGTEATAPSDPTLEGHAFAGWFIDEEEFNFDDVVETNITLTAAWDLITYSVTYDGNGADSGAAPVDATLYDYTDTTVTVLGAGTLVKAGHTLAGWNTAADGTGTGYIEDGTFTISDDTTLYAVWEVEGT